MDVSVSFDYRRSSSVPAVKNPSHLNNILQWLSACRVMLGVENRWKNFRHKFTQRTTESLCLTLSLKYSSSNYMHTFFLFYHFTKWSKCFQHRMSVLQHGARSACSPCKFGPELNHVNRDLYLSVPNTSFGTWDLPPFLLAHLVSSVLG